MNSAFWRRYSCIHHPLFACRPAPPPSPSASACGMPTTCRRRLPACRDAVRDHRRGLGTVLPASATSPACSGDTVSTAIPQCRLPACSGTLFHPGWNFLGDAVSGHSALTISHCHHTAVVHLVGTVHCIPFLVTLEEVLVQILHLELFCITRQIPPIGVSLKYRNRAPCRCLPATCTCDGCILYLPAC